MVVGCQPHAPAAFIPRDIPGTHFHEKLSRPQDHGLVGRKYVTEKSSDTTGNRSRDRPFWLWPWYNFLTKPDVSEANSASVFRKISTLPGGSPRSWVSKLKVAKGHIGYCGLVRWPHVQKLRQFPFTFHPNPQGGHNICGLTGKEKVQLYTALTF
jgi:hypothetical protein